MWRSGVDRRRPDVACAQEPPGSTRIATPHGNSSRLVSSAKMHHRTCVWTNKARDGLSAIFAPGVEERRRRMARGVYGLQPQENGGSDAGEEARRARRDLAPCVFESYGSLWSFTQASD